MPGRWYSLLPSLALIGWLGGQIPPRGSTQVWAAVAGFASAAGFGAAFDAGARAGAGAAAGAGVGRGGGAAVGSQAGETSGAVAVRRDSSTLETATATPASS